MKTMIRTCQLEDVYDLQALSKETFRETFEDQNSPQQLDNYIHQAFTLDRLKEELAHPSSYFFFIYWQQTLAGYLKVNMNEAQSESMGAQALEIERIYIKKLFHQLGLGRELFQKAIDLALGHHKTSIWLGVWEKNEQALAFYKKLGFVEIGQHSFYMGDEKQIDLLMSKTL